MKYSAASFSARILRNALRTPGDDLPVADRVVQLDRGHLGVDAGVIVRDGRCRGPREGERVRAGEQVYLVEAAQSEEVEDGALQLLALDSPLVVRVVKPHEREKHFRHLELLADYNTALHI